MEIERLREALRWRSLIGCGGFLGGSATPPYEWFWFRKSGQASKWLLCLSLNSTHFLLKMGANISVMPNIGLWRAIKFFLFLPLPSNLPLKLGCSSVMPSSEKIVDTTTKGPAKHQRWSSHKKERTLAAVVVVVASEAAAIGARIRRTKSV